MIDGALCLLNRFGARSVGHSPLASAVVEFLPGPLCYFVREHPYGLLPGLPNLYCLDAAFRLQWMAEWPATEDPCAAIVGLEGDTLVTKATSGAVVRVDAGSGRWLRTEQPLSAAS